MTFEYDDGGRQAAGYKGRAGDCVVRAVAIASGRPYEEINAALAHGTGKQRASKRTRARGATAQRGVNVGRIWFKQYMSRLGFVWTPTMGIGTGCTTHLRDGEIPDRGRLVVSVSKHYVAVVDNVIRDLYDPTRSATRCVYGYWELKKNLENT